MHTSIARVLSALNDPDPEFSNFESNDSIRKVFTNVAHFVADDKVVALLNQNKVHESIITLVKFGIHQLPFDPILIEFRDPTVNGVAFVRLQSQPIEPPAVPRPGLRADLYAYPLRLAGSIVDDVRRDYLLGTRADDPFTVAFTENDPEVPFKVNIGVSGWASGHTDKGKLEAMFGLDVAEAMSLAMLMLNTRGIDKVRVDTAKLNKARARSNDPRKVPVNPYTVLRIGTIYDRAGNAHSATGSGRHMPVHWRKGHVRMQRYGAGWSQERPIYIEPVLVNYDPGVEDKPRLPKHEVVL